MTLWSVPEFLRAGELTLASLGRHVEQARDGHGPAVSRRPSRDIAAALGLRSLIEKGGLDVDGLGKFLETYLGDTTRLHHPGYLAHQVAVPDFPAALADLVHGVTNNPTAIHEMGAAGATIEVEVCAWMLEKVGWARGAAAGVLTNGGSLANLTALLAARARVAPRAWVSGVSPGLVLLAPDSAHYSITRAAAILGLGEEAVRHLPTDRLGRIEVAALGPAIDRVRAEGQQVLAVVANACATGTGLHDDLEAIGGACEAAGVWLHVDAAHGASALLTQSHRHRLQGVERATSVIWDAHKMLRTSGLCAAVLFRHAADLDGAFHQEASYLFYEDDGPEVDSLRHTIECTKAALGLKLFLNLAWRGEVGLGEYVSRQYDLTRRIFELIRARPGFECPYEPESNILCFRYGRDSQQQVKIRERLLEDGRFHISSTEIGGERYLRLTVMSPATSERTIEELLDAIAAVR